MEGPRNILLAVDASEFSVAAMSFTLRHVVRPEKDTLYVLNVYEPAELQLDLVMIESENAIMPHDILEMMEDAQRRESEDMLASFSRMADNSRVVHFEGVSKRGEARAAILEFVKERKIDLLVVGSKGMGLVSRFLVGSVSDYCAQHSPCPVLVIHKQHQKEQQQQQQQQQQKERQQEGGAESGATEDSGTVTRNEAGRRMGSEGGKRTVVVAVDGSDLASDAFRWATRQFVHPESDRIVLLLCLPVPNWLGRAKELHPDVLLRLEEQEHKYAEGILQAMADEAAALGIECDQDVARGDPRQLICEEAANLGADALVLGNRGLSAISRAFLGSVSMHCLHNLDIPLAIVKPYSSA